MHVVEQSRAEIYPGESVPGAKQWIVVGVQSEEQKLRTEGKGSVYAE
jgi:hypothetical protein